MTREIEVFLTGIGGQGVQLAAKVLALAAMREGREVMSLGTYGGSMRGGSTDSTVVVADGAITSPPIVSRGWSALVAHPRAWPELRDKLAEGGIVVFDAGLSPEGLEQQGVRTFGVDAQGVARDAGAALGGSLVLLGAYCGVTGIVSLESLENAMKDALPPYRQQHLESNASALGAGYALLESCAVAAWNGTGSAEASA